MKRPVLVVDDDSGLREILRLALETEGYEVIAVRDGLEALQQIERERPALVLLDWMMPRMDGPAFVAELEARGLRRRLPVLLLTAANGAHERGAKIAADGVVTKPFELPELLAEVDRLVASGCASPTVG